MMDKPIFHVGGYKTSTDYEELARLMQKQAVVCLVDYRDDSEIRDVAHTIFGPVSRSGKGIWQISARGYGYIYAFSQEEFIHNCRLQHVEFIVPDGE